MIKYENLSHSNLKKVLLNSLLPIFVSLVLVAGITYAVWTEPTATPPEGNVAAPINISTNGQTFQASKELNMGSNNSGIFIVNGGTLSKGVFETWTTTSLATISGNVGIGTAHPTAKLEVNGSIKFSENDNDFIYLGETTPDNDNATTLRLTLGDDNSDAEKFEIYTDYWNGSDLDKVVHHFTAAGNVYHAGRVGINDTSPDALLDVNSNYSTDVLRLSNASNNSHYLRIIQDGRWESKVDVSNPWAYASLRFFDGTWSGTLSGDVPSYAPARGIGIRTIHRVDKGSYYYAGVSMNIENVIANGSKIDSGLLIRSDTLNYASSVPNIVGIYSRLYQDKAEASVDSFKAYYADTYISGGTLTNYYAFYAAGGWNATNRWAFYSPDANNKSYFAGNVGIGTPNPTAKLEISGGVTKTSGGLIIETRTSDPPNPETGRMWLRIDF